MNEIVVSIAKNRGMTVAEYAAELKRDMGMTIEIAMRMGATLKQAKADFKEQHQDDLIDSWSAAWKELLAETGLSQATANNLIQISEARHLGAYANRGVLPTGWTVLHLLSRLPETEFFQRVKAEEITPETTQRIVKGWLSPDKKSRSTMKNEQTSTTYVIDEAHNAYIRLANADEKQFVAEIVNLVSDSGVDVAEVIAALGDLS